MSSPQENINQFRMSSTTNAYLGQLKQAQDRPFPSSNLVKNVQSGVLFRKMIDQDPYFYVLANRGKAPYRIITYSIDRNETMSFEYIASDQPLIRKATLHANTYRKYFRSIPSGCEIVFGMYGEQFKTSDYNNLMVNVRIMGYEAFSIGNLIELVGVLGGAALSVGGLATGNIAASRLGSSISRATRSVSRSLD